MKKGLCFGLAALVAGFMATSAGAVDLDADTGTATFASEIAVDATNGTALANPATALDVTVDSGFGAAAGDQRYIRFNLSNDAEFLGDPAGMTLATAAGTLSSGGDGESFVIYSWTAPAAGSATSDDVALALNATGVTVFSEEDLTISYAMYETAGDAVNQTNALAVEDGVLLDFDDALVVDTDDVTTKDIDVTQESKVFSDATVDDTTTIIGDINVDVNGAFWTDGAAALLSDIVSGDTDLVISGDFSATQDLTAGEPDGTFTEANVYTDSDGNCDTADGTIAAATALTATTATFNVGTSAVADATTLCMAVNGVSVMSETTFTGLYDVVPAAATSDAADINLGNLSTIQKNGSSTRLPFALTPNGAYPYYVRIVNPSNIAGKVFMTLINDAGETASFDVSTVANVAGFVNGELPAGASTGLININDAFAAAQTADSTFDLASTSNKLRINVEAEFGENNTSSAVIANAFSLSQDGGTFNMVE